MGKPLDNPVSVALRNAADGTAALSEPVVEFARRKSPVHAADGFEVPPGGVDTAQLEFPPLPSAELPQISLPRDNAQPLVTSREGYAKRALEAYAGLRTRLLKAHASQGHRSIAITSVGKSEGKTLTSFNLACCCAHVKNLTVLLIDGDLRNRSLTRLVGPLPGAGLAEVMSGKATCEQAIVRTDLPNLFIMGAGNTADTSPTELFSTDKWGQVVRWSRQHFKVMLVDALAMAAAADFELIAPECDGVLLVVRARSTSREALKMAVEQIEGDKLIGVVWNGGDSMNGSSLYS